MSESARIESIAELRAFRVALVKFVDACNVALGDAESDMQRTHQWLERDQISFWNGQLAKRAEIVSRAKEAVRMKKLYKSPTGATQSVVEEEKALRVAIRNYEEAEQKIVACKQWARRMQKEIMMYKGGVSRFTSVLGGDIPRALASLDVMARSLEEYAALSAGGGGAGAASGAGSAAAFAEAMMGGMARSPDEAATDAKGAAQARDHYQPLDIAALRDNVPPADVRAGAPAGDVNEETWLIPRLTADARKAVVDLNQPGRPVDGGQTVVIAKGAWSAPTVYMERRAPASERDTGWFIASVELGGIPALGTVPVRDLLEARPDFRELLTLPDGFLVVLNEVGIRAIFTPTGDDLAQKPAQDNPPD